MSINYVICVELFISLEDAVISVCKICNNNIKRGNNPKSYSISPLHKHLTTKYIVIYTKAKKASLEKAGSSTSSPSAPNKIKLAAMKQTIMDDFKPLKIWTKMVQEKLTLMRKSSIWLL